MKNKIIKLTEVVWQKDNYIRSEYNWRTAYEYSLAMKRGDKFPAIIVTPRKGKYIGIDGRHRCEANKLIKSEFVDASIQKPMSDEEIYVYSIELNNKHGQKLTSTEKVAIVLRLKDLGYDSNKISGLVRMPTETLQKFVAKRTAYSPTGETIVLKAAVRHLAGTEMQHQEEVATWSLASGHQLQLVKDLNTLVHSRLINWKNALVVGELIRLKKGLDKYKTLQNGKKK